MHFQINRGRPGRLRHARQREQAMNEAAGKAAAEQAARRRSLHFARQERVRRQSQAAEARARVQRGAAAAAARAEAQAQAQAQAQPHQQPQAVAQTVCTVCGIANNQCMANRYREALQEYANNHLPHYAGARPQDPLAVARRRNKAARAIMFTHYIRIRHGTVGCGVTIQVPACVARLIRDMFPDPLGNYGGHAAFAARRAAYNAELVSNFVDG